MTVHARLATFLGLVIAAALLMPGTAVFAAKSGNTAGFVTIDGVPFANYPNDEPHVGCVFQLDFYGFGEGDLFADVTFSARPPSGTTTLLADQVFVGEDPAGGATDLDAQSTYDIASVLTSLVADPDEGYHIMITVAGPGRAKNKTFWIQAC